MTPPEPKTKHDILIDMGNHIVNEHLEKQTGLCCVDNSVLKQYLDVAEKNKTGSYADFHYIKALVHTVKGNLKEAKRSYSVAIQNDSSNPVILGNYATLLIDMHEYDNAKVILRKLISGLKLDSSTVWYSVFRIALNTLNPSIFNEFFEMEKITSDTNLINEISKLKEDISYIDISTKEYTEYIELLSSFVLRKTRQNFQPRFSINRGLEKNLTIEVFLNINQDQASYLNTEFTTDFVNSVFEKGNYELLGKFLVYFKQKKNRNDGSENPDALYLGMNEELGA